MKVVLALSLLLGVTDAVYTIISAKPSAVDALSIDEDGVIETTSVSKICRYAPEGSTQVWVNETTDAALDETCVAEEDCVGTDCFLCEDAPDALVVETTEYKCLTTGILRDDGKTIYGIGCGVDEDKTVCKAWLNTGVMTPTLDCEQLVEPYCSNLAEGETCYYNCNNPTLLCNRLAEESVDVFAGLFTGVGDILIDEPRLKIGKEVVKKWSSKTTEPVCSIAWELSECEWQSKSFQQFLQCVNNFTQAMIKQGSLDAKDAQGLVYLAAISDWKPTGPQPDHPIVIKQREKEAKKFAKEQKKLADAAKKAEKEAKKLEKKEKKAEKKEKKKAKKGKKKDKKKKDKKAKRDSVLSEGN